MKTIQERIMNEFEERSERHKCDCLIRKKLDDVHLCVFKNWKLVCHIQITEMYDIRSGYQIELSTVDSRIEIFKAEMNNFEVMLDVFETFEKIIGC